MKLFIDSDINRAKTLPTEFYRSQQIFDESRQRIFCKSWQMINGFVEKSNKLVPFSFCWDYVDERRCCMNNIGMDHSHYF